MTQDAQKTSFLYTFREFYCLFTMDRLFPLLYVLIVMITIPPSSIVIAQNITPDQQSMWV